MTPTPSIFDPVRTFFSESIWRDPPSDAPVVQRYGIRLVRLLVIVFHDFGRDNCMLRASALTYATLLAIVPLLAFAFAVLKGLGVQNQIEPLIIEHLAVGSEAVVTRIIEYINNTNVARLGSVGLGMLLLTVLALLSNIEKSFNSVWGVTETRTLLRRFADYFSVLAFGPLLLVVAMSMTATIQTLDIVQELKSTQYLGDLIRFAFKTLPYVAMWIAFTFLYIFMPNIRVRLPAAFVGGVVGGTLWQLGQLSYVHFQVGVARYNAIYGTMAALPIFMVWIYFSWMIVLFGLEITSSLQNLQSISHRIRAEKEQLRRHDYVGLAVLLAVVRAFLRGTAPVPVQRLAEQLDLLPVQVTEIARELVAHGYLARASLPGQEYGFLPNLAPAAIPVGDVLNRIRGELPETNSEAGEPDWVTVRGVAAMVAQAEAGALDEMTLQDLAEQTLDPGAGEGQAALPVE